MRGVKAIYRWISPKCSAGKIFTRAVCKNQTADSINPQAIISEHAAEMMIKHAKFPLNPVGMINQPVGMTNRQVGIANQSVGMTNRQVGIINQSVGMTN